MSMDEILAEMKRLLTYDPITGEFVRKVSSGSRASAGMTPGYIAQNGYRMISLLGKMHLAHRLAWLYIHGSMPPGRLDHINRDRADNRISNLRIATAKQNGENQTLSVANTSGVKGVTWCKANYKWLAQIQHNKVNMYLGYYSNIADAKVARRNAEAKFFTHSGG